MTQEKAIKLLRAMKSNTYDVAKMDEADGYTLRYHCGIHEVIALDQAITILTDDEFAEDLWKIFFKDEAIA